MNKITAPRGETKMEPLLSYPYNAFLMVRLEFVQILQDDLQAKLLRIIEAHIETQRLILYRESINQKPDQPIDIPKDIFVPISYKLFMNDLYDLVTSENTIKKALNQMIEYKIIFRKPAPSKRYAAPEYSINTTALQILLDALKNPEYQKLIPSIIEALKNSYPQDLIPSWYQDLIPSILKSSLEDKSRVSEVDTNIRKKNIIGKNESKVTPKVPVTEPDSLIHSSTQSSSQETETPQEPVVERNDTKSFPSDEQKRIDGYLKKLRFPFPRNKENFEYLAMLTEYIESFEQMKSYYDFTRARFQGVIFLGNLANLNNLNMWLQTQAPPPEKQQSNQEKFKITPEYLASLPM